MSRLPPGRAEIRRDLLVLGVLVAILFLVRLGARDLWHPNEPTYGQAVAEMAASGDWLRPTVNGKLFAEKPILYYWMALVATRGFGGVNEFTLRLPSALAALCGVVFVYLLVIPYAGRKRARLAAALFATIFSVFWNARSVQMDILVAVSTAAVVLAVSRVVDHGAPPLRGWCLAGLAAGFGFLAKGPVAVICPGVGLVAYLLLTRRAGELARPAVLAGAGVFAAVVAPWLIALAARGETGFLIEAFWRQNVVRAQQPWDHQSPWWYYFPYFWIDMAPWAFFVPLAIGIRDREPEERSLDRLAWVWLAGVIVFFSLFSSKRSAYLLPIAGAVAVLASGVAERLTDGRLRGVRVYLALGLHAAAGAAFMAAGWFARFRLVPRYPDLSLEGRALAALLIAGGATILVTFLSPARVRVAAPSALFSLVLCVYLVAAVAVLPAVDAYKSARPFCERAGSMVSDRPLASYKFWDWRAAYSFYLRRPVRNLKSIDALREYWGGSQEAFLIVEEPMLPEARLVLGDGEPLVRSPVGGKVVYLFSNR